MKILTAGMALAAVLITVSVSVTGCIHTEETVVKDESRAPVEFENDTAGRVFYEALSRMPDAERRTEKESEVSIPVVFSHKQKVVRGSNHAFNQAVLRCDTNRDGRITESEARIFSESVP